MKRKTFIKVINILILTIVFIVTTFCLQGCSMDVDATAYDTKSDMRNTQEIADKLVSNQPTPTDIDYSLERYNLTRRVVHALVYEWLMKSNKLDC